LLREAGQKAEREGNLRTAINDWQDAKKCSDASRCPDLDKLIASAKSKIEEDTRQCEAEIDRLGLKIDQLNEEIKDLEKENTGLSNESKKTSKQLGEYEEKVWRIIDSLHNEEAYKSYCREFPNGKFYNIARQKTGEGDIQSTLPALVKIPGGNFQMGHGSQFVQVGNFYLSKFEVTNAEFCAFLNEMGNQIEGGKKWIGIGSSENGYSCKIMPKGTKFQVESGFENHPVAFVTWYGASSYCEWLSQTTGKIYRLPSQAEWEYAAGNGVKHTTYSWGFEQPIDKEGGNISDVSFCRANAVGREIEYFPFEDYHDGYVNSAPVGSYSPNDFGVHDMSGNVWEWCVDGRMNGEDYNNKNIEYAVIKGGSWRCNSGSEKIKYFKKGREVSDYKIKSYQYDTTKKYITFDGFEYPSRPTEYEYSRDYKVGSVIANRGIVQSTFASATIGFRVASSSP
jgi:formylglycine-generating enzyme required for sulfatase activity